MIDQTARTDLTPAAARELLDRQVTLLAMLLHELRGPLTILSGHLSLINEGVAAPTPGPARSAYAAMRHATNEMSALIESVAALARRDVQGGIRRGPCDLRNLADDAVAAVRHEALERHVTITRTAPKIVVNGVIDPEHTQIAIVNLLRNAIDHNTPGGRVTLTIEDDERAVAVIVSDDGPGIDAHVRPHLFEPWCRGAGRGNGWGLGLWIVGQIAAWHGGSVIAESSPNHGSTFTMTLPRDGGDRVYDR